MIKPLTPAQVVFLTAGVAFFQIHFKLPEEADTYFLMNLGRYVLEHGLPHVDPFTIHENLQLVAQQWLSGVIFWEVFNNLGYDGLRLIDTVCGATLVLINWRLCLLVSGNKVLSFVLSFAVGLLMTPLIVPRPQILSTPLLLIEVFLLEKFTRTRAVKFLLPLPLISVALINLHAAVWLMSLVICLPFLFVKSWRHVALILVAMALIGVGGLANPYGVDAMTYVFSSYGVEAINKNVKEMFTPTAHEFHGKCFYFTAALLIASLAKFKAPWRYVFLSGGLAFMAVMHSRNEILFYTIATFPIVHAWRDFSPEKFLAGSGDTQRRGLLTIIFFLMTFVNTAVITALLQDKLDRLTTPLTVLLFASILVVLYTLLVPKFEGRLLHPAILPKKIGALLATALAACGIMFTTLDGKSRESDETFTRAIEFILRDNRPEDISLYINQGAGGLAGMYGIRYYIDSRSEVFLPANNGQKNILEEYLDLKSGVLYYADFLSRYAFTHIIVTNADAVLYNALIRDENFRVIYESETVAGYNVFQCKVFVPKGGE